MESFFRGRFEAKLDPKGRLSLPSAYRQMTSETLVITNSLFKGRRCLDAYHEKAWESLEARIQKLSPLKAEVQAFQRFYLSGAQVVELDTQNRVLIPQGLRQYANLESEVVLVGMGEKFEVWPRLVWQQIYEDLVLNFDENLSNLSKLEWDS